MSDWYMGQLAEDAPPAAAAFPPPAPAWPDPAPPVQQPGALARLGNFIAERVRNDPWFYPSEPQAPGEVAAVPSYDPNTMGYLRGANAIRPLSREGREEGVISEAVGPTDPYTGVMELALGAGGPSKVIRKTALGVGGLLASTTDAEAAARGISHGISRIVLPESVEALAKRNALVRSKDIAEKTITPHDIPENSWLTFLIGDRSRSGELLTHVGERELKNPVWMQGGYQYMPEWKDKGIAWASDPGPITGMAGRVEKMSQDAPGSVYGVYSAMGPQSVDFSHHMSDTLSQMMKFHRNDVGKTATERFDRLMREAVPKGEPDWPGVKSPKLQSYLRDMPGTYRDYFAKTMNTREALEAGFPDVAQARIAVTHPSLIDQSPYASGASISKLKPEAIHSSLVAPHTTYKSKLAGEYVGGLEQSVPAHVMWPNWSQQVSRRDPSAVGRIWQTGLVGTPPGQRVTPQWQDSVAEWLRRNRMGDVARQ
jgi:hypothetical protein